MKEELFDIKNFNIIKDRENYYFFRALNIADNNDIERGISTTGDGKIERIRTDRERFEGKTKYSEDSEISLEELYDHIKMHYRKDTNCISLTSNSNVAVNYGRGSYKDKYVMIKIPQNEFGEKIVNAGQYMLQEKFNSTVNLESQFERLSGLYYFISSFSGSISRSFLTVINLIFSYSGAGCSSNTSLFIKIAAFLQTSAFKYSLHLSISDFTVS